MIPPSGLPGQLQRVCQLQILPALGQRVQAGLVTTAALVSGDDETSGPGSAAEVTVSLLPTAG